MPNKTPPPHWHGSQPSMSRLVAWQACMSRTIKDRGPAAKIATGDQEGADQLSRSSHTALTAAKVLTSTPTPYIQAFLSTQQDFAQRFTVLERHGVQGPRADVPCLLGAFRSIMNVARCRTGAPSAMQLADERVHLILCTRELPPFFLRCYAWKSKHKTPSSHSTIRLLCPGTSPRATLRRCA